MNNLLAFFAKYNHWMLFVVLEVISLVLLFRFNNYQGSIYFTTANAVAGQAYVWESAAESFLSMSKNNRLLTQRNLYLEQQVEALNKQLGELTQDTTPMSRLSSGLLSGYRLMPAKVITNDINGKDNYITIDKGEADGVKRDMGVASGDGVVGVVYMTSAHYSIVMPLLHSQTNLSVAIDKRGYFGYLRWKGGRSDLADVDDVPRHARFKLGDRIVTSGYSSIFPPGLPVGKVLYAFNSADGLSYRLLIHLDANFGHLRDVCVIDNAPMQERIELMRAAQDSIAARKN